MHGWMDGRMDGWMDGWMDGYVHFIVLYVLYYISNITCTYRPRRLDALGRPITPHLRCQPRNVSEIVAPLSL